MKKKSLFQSAIFHGAMVALVLVVGLIWFKKHEAATEISVDLHSVENRGASPGTARAPHPSHPSLGSLPAEPVLPHPVENSVHQDSVAMAPVADGSPIAQAPGSSLGAPGPSTQIAELYLSSLQKMIEARKTYPVLSKRFRETGTVVVHFVISREGNIHDVALQKASAHARLNDASLELIRGIHSYQPFPPAMPQPQLVVNLPIEYNLH